MKDDRGVQYHIHCKKGDVGRYVFLPGDPARSEIIARKFDEHWKVAENREFVTYSGMVDGVKVSVTSTGIGGPSTAIAVEELIEIGADTFIRVGGGGGMQPEVKAGDLVIATSAVRDEGTTQWLIPMEYPAVADHDVVSALIQAAENLKKAHHMGISVSKAAFYGQEFFRDTYPSGNELDNRFQTWVKGNVMVDEMEAAVIFVLASIKRKRAGCIITCGGTPDMAERKEKKSIIESVYSKADAIDVAIESVRILAKRDKEKSKRKTDRVS